MRSDRFVQILGNNSPWRQLPPEITPNENPPRRKSPCLSLHVLVSITYCSFYTHVRYKVLSSLFLSRDIDLGFISVSPSVCLSVCLSVRDVPVLDENGLTYCQFFSPYGSPIILFLSASNIFTKCRSQIGLFPFWGRCPRNPQNPKYWAFDREYLENGKSQPLVVMWSRIRIP